MRAAPAKNEADKGVATRVTDIPDDRERLIHQVKRTRWQQKGGGEEYQFYAYKNDAITRLKNITEISFVLRNAVGPRILDAGAGTGRFTIPLRQKGFETTGVDISAEMLAQGVKHSHRSGVPFRCLVGDIERLPFPDAAFDTVVSITVLRHFPKWRDILREYCRVTRSGGRVIFDMGSGEQQAFLTARGCPPGNGTVSEDPIAFEAAIRVDELNQLACALGVTPILTTPYDFFHVNDLLRFALMDGYEDFLERLEPLMNTQGALALCEAVTRGVFPSLSPALTSSWLIVLEKTPSETPAKPSYRDAAALVPTGDPEWVLLWLVQACMGANAGALRREALGFLSDPDAARFVEFCRAELLPRLPLEAVCWYPGC